MRNTSLSHVNGQQRGILHIIFPDNARTGYGFCRVVVLAGLTKRVGKGQQWLVYPLGEVLQNRLCLKIKSKKYETYCWHTISINFAPLFIISVRIL